MRIFATLSPEPTFWVENIYDIGRVRSNVQIARSDFIFLMGADDRESAKRNLMKLPVEQSKILLQEMFMKFSISSAKLSKSVVDLTIGTDIDSGINFAQYEDDNKWRDELRRRKQAVELQEPREKAFDRLLHRILSVSRHVQLVDPYAATDIVRQGGRVWLLERMMEVPSLKIEIFTRPALPVDKNDQRTQSQLDDKLSEMLNQIKKRFEPKKSDLSLYLIDPPRAQFHNRRMRIHNDTQQIALVLERGVDVFDESIALEQQTFSEMSPIDFQKHWDRLRKLEARLLQ